MSDKRSVLADYLDRRVTVIGIFDRTGNNPLAKGGWVRWVRFQDVRVEVDGKQLDVGHVHVQHAAALEKHDLLPGDKIKVTCRVTTYNKRLPVTNEDALMVERCYGLSYPENIEVIERAPRPQVDVPKPVTKVEPVQPQAAKEADAGLSDLDQLLKVKESAHQVGGLDRLVMLAETLRRLAG